MERGTFGRVTIVAVVVALACAVSGASTASAQNTLSGIAGVVRDAGGSPVAGVTVEAESPVLIEKVRSVTTNALGQFLITDLQPGTYSVTFKAPGFSAVRNVGIELTAGFQGTVNAALRPGNPSETVTVTGATTTIDTRTTAQQNVVGRDSTVASGRDAQAAVSVTRGLATTATDVGGAAGAYSAQGNSLTVRGKAGVKRLFDGLRVENAEGIGNTSYMINSAMVDQTVVETGGGSASSLSAGGSINNVPKSGSNNFQFRISGLVSTEGMQGDNLTDELRARGLTAVNKVGNIWDTTVSAGGPIKKDKLWFFAAPKMWGNRNYAAGVFWNDTQGTPYYTPANGTGIDSFGVQRVGANGVSGLPIRRADQFETIRSQPFRLTWQATRRDKINIFVDYPQAACTCRSAITTTAPEVGTYIFGRKGHLWETGLFQGTWASPRTSKLLMEGGWSFAFGGWPQVYQPTVTRDHISIIDSGIGFTYNDKQGAHQGLQDDPRVFPIDPSTERYAANHVSDRMSERFTTLYVTGSHAYKFGVSLEQVWHEGFFWVNQINVDPASGLGHPVNYQFNNGVPSRITEFSTPYTDNSKVKAELAIFAQDQWTIKKLTVNYGLRYSYFNAGVDPQHADPTRFIPFARDYGAVSCVPCWHDLDPRFGAAYDVFGNGRTAIKGSFGRYITQQVVAIATANNPFNTSVNSVTRSWSDNGNFFPDCNLENPLQNGECGQISDLNFGLSNPFATRYADETIHGFGNRGYVWDSSLEVQHRLTSTATVTGGYYRNWAKNFLVTDNQATSPSDFDPFCVTTPNDARLPGGGNQRLCGLYDVTPAAFSRRSQNEIRLDKNFGEQLQYNDFFGASLALRLPRNARANFNVDTGRTVNDNCFTTPPDSPQQQTFDVLGGNADFCRKVTPFAGNLTIRLNGSHPLPYGFTVSANYQNGSGVNRQAIWNAPNVVIQPELGRPLAACGTRQGAACTSTVPIPLIEFGTDREARRNQLDLRFGKSQQLGKKVRFTGDVGIYNVLNNSSVSSLQTAFGQAWLKPNTVLYARLLQLSARLDF